MSADTLATLEPRDRFAAEWLLRSDEPAVRALTLRRVLGLPDDDREVIEARERAFEGPIVARLLRDQAEDGGFGLIAYAKWQGTHWRLLALTELEVPPDDRLRAAAEHELAWVRSPSRPRRAGPIHERYRRCGSQEGAALAACVHLGMADDERVAALARDLLEWQWPDGGWNCDLRPQASHSSFNESLKPLWALDAYARATSDRGAAGAAASGAHRAAEFFLAHRMFRSERTGQPVSKALRLRFPAYWHYDVLDGLVVLMRAGRLGDPRTADALDEVQAQRLPDGRWRADGAWWRPRGSAGVDIVDWGRSGPNEFLTLRALAVLRAAGRLRVTVEP